MTKVFRFLSVYVFSYVGTVMNVWLCGGQKNHLRCWTSSSTLLETECLYGRLCIYWLVSPQSSGRPLVSASHYLMSAGITEACYWAQLYVGPGNPNSHPHVWPVLYPLSQLPSPSPKVSISIKLSKFSLCLSPSAPGSAVAVSCHCLSETYASLNQEHLPT